jgi:acyl dehydratase
VAFAVILYIELKELSVDYSQLAPGQEISIRTLEMTVESVARYTDAVGDSNRLREDGRELVPAMAVAALSLGGVINDLQIPGGTVHAGQELEFCKAVPVGVTLDCKATLVQNSVRGEWRFMVVSLEVMDGEGQKVMDGKSTIMLPI